jgi:hypothetical protein
MRLDHFYICVDDPAAAERALTDFGLQFTLHATHPGQGTTNACAFFENMYLELLIHRDEDELLSAPVRPLALWERLNWRHSGASPFGVGLRAASGDAIDTWKYDAPFLPPGLHLPIVTPRDTPVQPLLFLIPADWPVRTLSATQHRGRRRTVTGIRIQGPQVASDLLPADPVLELRTAAEHHLDVQWDHGIAGESWDFRPALPLTINL